MNSHGNSHLSPDGHDSRWVGTGTLQLANVPFCTYIWNGDLTCMKPHTIVYKYVFRVSSIAYRNIFLQIWYDRPVNVAQRARTLLPCAVAPSVPSSLSSFTFLPSLCVLWQRHLHTLSQTSETTKLHHQKYNVCAPFNHLRSYNIIEIWISYIFPLCFGPKVNLY